MEFKNINIRLIEQNNGQIEGLPKNPRQWKKRELENLRQSIAETPELLEARGILVYPHKNKFIIIGGNMRYAALKSMGVKEIPCIVIPEDTGIKKLKEIVIKDNGSFGDWDFDMLANEWDDLSLTDWGVPVWDTSEAAQAESSASTDESSADEIEQKRKEFEERMAAGEISEEDEEYQEFLEKFKLKKTTDDCYTPAIVYDAVADWVANEYGLNRSDFVRPFYPGGDYEHENYPKGCVVVDNPPFSILAEIMRFYNSKGIKFFLFAPHLTLLSSSSSSTNTNIATGVIITYENGAKVNTSFITNIAPGVTLKSCPSLYKAVDEANKENLKAGKVELPKYEYDKHVVLAPWVGKLSQLGIEFEVPASECQFIRNLDSQKEYDKAIYGSGLLVSDRVKAEREKAEREKAERVKLYVWKLSDREWAIVEQLNKKANE